MYPTLMLLCAYACVSGVVERAKEWVRELGWCHGDESSLWIWRGAHNVHCLLSSASVLSLHTHPHTSPTFNHLLLGQFLIWLLCLFFFINHGFLFLMITHACLKACPSAFCQMNPDYMSVEFVSLSHWISWYAIMNGLHFPPVIVVVQWNPPWNDFWCLCHPTLNDFSVIGLTAHLIFNLWPKAQFRPMIRITTRLLSYIRGGTCSCVNSSVSPPVWHLHYRLLVDDFNRCC